MARCRSYLRGLDICVTVLLLVSGMLMITVGFTSIDGNKPVAKLLDQLSSSDGLLVLQVLGPITVVLSLLGLCAASLDIKPLLLLFSALILVEFVALIVVASPLIQIQAQMDSAVEDVFLNVTPLHKAETYIKQELSKLQASESCCGLRSFEDWEDQPPASCLCTPPTPFTSSLRSTDVHNTSSVDCMLAVSETYRVPLKTWVHSKPCGPILKSYLSFPIKLRIGIISAVTTIIIAAIALSLAMGLEKYWRSPAVESTVDDYNRVKYQPQPYLS
ncbi:23 kDa integral membrane protein-like [Boleophthalmus pectinirostris]|uniref:23 kDa integral membrane protein-like n=1 Tax=Boleophthalmus pectinirostris TaxID=150288 RepID=UPI000A1C74D8|nr:23 kDa integral membrane protein-like [Boleophthalmus pectinirostris]